MNGRPWTEEEDAVLRELYGRMDMMASEIGAKIGRSAKSIYSRASILGLKVPFEKARISGRMSCNHPNNVATRFQKGHVPANKGKKMRPEVYARCAPTMFKPGQRPPLWRPVGSERINVDGYVEVKVSDQPPKWGLKHRIVWEQANGPIPPGCNIQFKNHITTDCRLENLYLISRQAQLATENSLHARYPKDLQYVMMLKGALKRRIRKLEKDGKQCESGSLDKASI